MKSSNLWSSEPSASYIVMNLSSAVNFEYYIIRVSDAKYYQKDHGNTFRTIEIDK
jgi:tRNA C32,U32 (ribose-2'-O)-methylase TrmJ